MLDSLLKPYIIRLFIVHYVVNIPLYSVPANYEKNVIMSSFLYLQSLFLKKKVLFSLVILIYLLIPSTVFWVYPDSHLSILFNSIIQVLFTLFIAIITLPSFEYRNNPFIVGSFIFFIYLGLAPIITYNKINIISTSWQQWLIEEGINNRYLIKSQILLNIWGVTILLLGFILSTFFRSIHTSILGYLSKKYFFFTVLSLFLLASQIYFAINGQFALGGFSENAIENGISPVLAILFPCFFLLPFLSGYYIKIKAKFLFVWYFILLLQLPWLLLMNKRSLIIGIYLFIFNYYSFETLKITWKKILSGSLLCFFIILAFNAFQSLRLYEFNTIINNQDYELLFNIFTDIDTSVLEEANDIYTAKRFFATHLPVARFCYIYETFDIHLLNGEGVMNAFKVATPGNFFFNKENILVNEPLYTKRFGSLMDFDDVGDTIILQGLIDFGYIGIGLYICAFLGLIYFAYKIIRFANNYFVLLLFFIQIIMLSMNLYEETFGDVFVFIRFVISISIFSYITSFLSSLSFKFLHL